MSANKGRERRARKRDDTDEAIGWLKASQGRRMVDGGQAPVE